jgi:serine/threonine-protein kinase
MLGTTLWEMTTMRRLFKREEDSETLMAVRAGLVPDPRATVPTYPEDLWAIVRRALARDREDRYSTAAELAHDLDAFVAGQRREGDQDMALMSGAILDALFPGEREKRAVWLKRVNAQRQERGTMPPPATVVGAHTPSMAPRPPSDRPPRKPRSTPKIRMPRG